MPPGAPEPEPSVRAGTPRRAPALWVAAAILAGYALGAVWPRLAPGILAAAAIPFAIAAVVLAAKAPLEGFRQKRWFAPWAACFLVAGALLAWLWRDLRAQPPSPDWLTLPPREATLTIRILHNFRPFPDGTYSDGLAHVVDAPPVFRELIGQNVMFGVRTSDVNGQPARGATLKIIGLLDYLPDLTATADAAPKDASSARFRTYLHAQGAWFELSRARLVAEVAAPNWWQRWLTVQHAHLESLLRQGPASFEAQWGDTYVALVMGEPTLLGDPQRQIFTTAGTVYLFAISGLHVGILAAALFWLCRQIPGLPHAAGEAFALAVSWLYVEIAGGTPSARRAALMLTVYLLARWFGRARNALAAVLAAGIVTVLFDPLALSNAGFQLSYSVALGLILYTPWLLGAARARLMPWRDVPAPTLAPWKKCARWIWGRVMDLFTVSWTALLCSAPLMAEFFGVFSAHSLFLNLGVFPLTCIALWSGAGAVAAGLCGFPPPTWLAWCANALGLRAVGLMEQLAQFTPPVPGFFMRLQLMPAWAGSAATLVVLLVMLFGQPRGRVPRWWYFVLPVLVLAIGALLAARPAPA